MHVDRTVGRVDPKLFGHFIEHMGRCIYGGLWAEMLRSRKFDGPDLHEFGVVAPWESVGKGAGVFFNHDNTHYYTGRQSQKIVVRQDDGRLHGVGQGDLCLRGGRAYRLRVVACREGLAGPLRFTLEDKEGRPYAVEERHCPEGQWHTLEATLLAPVDDPLGRLSITCRGTGTLWLGAASLMPADNLEGWRADVLEAVRALRPPLLRWPGGNFASAYHWQDGIGPRDERPTRLDPVWNAREPNDVGTVEFMALARELGSEPYLCVNVGSGTPEEAAAWVEYCNGPATSACGALRARDGHPEPYAVRYWGVGNETYGNWQHGHVDAETYARRLRAFADAMRAVDPSIKLVAVGAHEYEAPGWNDAVLSLAGDRIDYLSLHHYTPGGVPQGQRPSHEEFNPVIMAGPVQVEELLREAEAAIARHGLAGRVRIALDEWNTWVYTHYECDQEAPFLLRDGLYAASIFNVLYRHSNQVGLANLAQLVNVLGAIYTTPTGYFCTPVYLACQLHREHSGALAVETEVSCSTFDAAGMCFMPPRAGVPCLDAAATLDEAGGRLYLSLVNRDPARPVDVAVEIDGAAAGRAASGRSLTGPGPFFGNSAARPDVVRLEHLAPFPAGNRFTYTVPAHTATVIEVPVVSCQWSVAGHL